MWWRERKAHREHVAWCAAATKVEGAVSRLGTRDHLSRNKPTDDDNISIVPVVRFRAANNVDYEIDCRDAPRTIGAPVAVAYDPALPSSARAVARVPRIGCAAIALLIGVALAVWGLTH
jgi:hypothetical protein